MRPMFATGAAMGVMVVATPAPAQPSGTPLPGAQQAGARAPSANGEVAAETSPATVDLPEDTAPDIVVTGIRRSNQAAIESKRNATNIIDVVSATDARALPDLTIVETLRRVPGLAVLPATDNEHPRDEAATPVLRGLGPAYNNVTLDGLTIASPGTPQANLGSINRGVRLDLLPTSMISELQVVKTFTADLDPNAVGGAINLKTRSAFENGGKPFFTAEAALGHASDNGKPRRQPDPGYRVSATGSLTFGPDKTFGLVVSGNYQTLASYTETHMTSDTVHYNFYDAKGVRQVGNNLGNGIAVPQLDKYWYVMDKRDRYGLTGKLEFQPTASLHAFVTGGYYFFRDDMERNELVIDPRNTLRVFDQTPTSGRYPGADIEIGWSNQVTTTRTRLVQGGVDWKPADHQVLSLRGAWSRATYDEPIKMIKYASGIVRSPALPAGQLGGAASLTATSPYAFDYDTSAPNQQFAVPRAAYDDYANYTLLYWRPDYRRNAADDIATARLDYAFNQGPDDRGFGAGAGASFTDDRPSYSVARVEYQPNVSAPALSVRDVLGPLTSPLKWSDDLYLITIDPAKASAIFEGLPKSVFNQTDQTSFNNQDNFRHRERIWGAYATASFRSDALLVQGGLRYDNLDQTTVGALRRGKAFVDVPTASTSVHWLPSALAVWHLTDRLDVRAGASRTLGRPPYDAYAARSSIVFVNPADAGNPNAIGVNVSIGNPGIRPRRSDNLDLSVEYRVGGGFDGLIALAGFDKAIKDEIFTLSTLGYTDGGTTYVNAVVNRPANASSARIRGLEFNTILNSFKPVAAFLGGFGGSFNASLLDGRIDVPSSAGAVRRLDRLVGQPNYTLNGTLFYNANGLELRGAFNRQGKALRSIVADVAWQDLYWAPRSQIDVSASYAVTGAVTIVGQVSNLTHNRITSVTGPGKNLLKDSYSIPTTFWLGIRLTPKF
jgi:TonB-dependent receptor